MKYTDKDHTWIICAYRESPFLEACIRSLKEQTVRSRILLATSTPNGTISALAEKYGIPVFINEGEKGIGGDWNFALDCAETELRTIAHQDDLYEEHYTEDLIRTVNRARDPILYFTNYGELRNDRKTEKNRLLRIKRAMLIPIRLFPRRRWARRLSLAFGNAVCCPSVTYVMSRMGDRRFGSRFASDLDWEMSEQLSREKGSFVYNPQIRMYHRIHGDSATTGLIGDHRRMQEDYEMMRKFWPDRIARRLARIYASSEKSNQV